MKKIIELKNQLPSAENEDKANILVQISEEYSKLNDSEEQSAYLKAAIIEAKKCKQDNYLADCYHRLGLNEWKKNEFLLAQQNFKKALEYFEENNDDVLAAKMVMSIGVTNWNLGNNYQALAELGEAVFRIIKTKNKILLANAYNWLGIVCGELNELDKAMKYYLRGLRINEKLGNKLGIAIAKNSIGLIYLKLDDFGKAHDFLSSSLKIRREIKDFQGIADCLSNIGMLFAAQAEYNKSLKFYLESIDIRKEHGGKAKLSNTINNVGNTYAKLGKSEKAIRYLKKSLNIRKEIGNLTAMQTSCQNIADYLIELNQLPEAEKYLEKAIEIEKKVPESKVNFRNYLLLSYLCEKKEEHKKALEMYKKYIEIQNELNVEQNRVRIAELQTKYETEKQVQHAKYLKLKNVELQKANDLIQDQNNELKIKNDHIELTSKILRHDIANNLTVMHSAIKLYQRKNDLSFLDALPQQIDKSVNLIKKMRNLSSIVSKKRSLHKVDLRVDILDKLPINYPEIIFEINGDAFIWGDVLLESIFDNLVSNSIRHGHTSKIKIDILPNRDFIQLDFIDFGKGIPENIKNFIFEKNFAYGRNGNTGLGLFIVKKAIESYEGSIGVQENLPKGTIFTLKFKKAQ